MSARGSRHTWRRPATAVAVALAVLAAAAAHATAVTRRAPAPLRGIPLEEATRLRLLVADNPPFVLDVDSGRAQRVAGIRRAEGAIVTGLERAGNGALVTIDHAGRGAVYVLGAAATRARLLAEGIEAAPARDGRSALVLVRQSPGRCVLRTLPLAGGAATSSRPRSCAAHLDAAKRRALARLRLPWPSALRGRDESVLQPGGRLVALGFADPAWGGSGTQVADVWLFDRDSRTAQQLPDMPAIVSLKFTSMSWADDGRLVFLAESERRNVVGVWTPGEERIRVKAVRIPQRTGGSDSFVVLPL